MNDAEDNRTVTREILRLELKAQMSQVRLLIIASVALNQFLTNVTLPAEVAVPAIVTAILAPLAKAAFLVLKS